MWSQLKYTRLHLNAIASSKSAALPRKLVLLCPYLFDITRLWDLIVCACARVPSAKCTVVGKIGVCILWVCSYVGPYIHEWQQHLNIVQEQHTRSFILSTMNNVLRDATRRWQSRWRGERDVWMVHYVRSPRIHGVEIRHHGAWKYTRPHYEQIQVQQKQYLIPGLSARAALVHDMIAFCSGRTGSYRDIETCETPGTVRLTS